MFDSKKINYLTLFILISFFLFQSVYLLKLTDQYAVNILFWDQWDLYNVFFNDVSRFKYFTFQHGPHRQGIGFYFTAILNYFSNWDTRVESFGIFALLIISCLSALWLNFKLAGKFSIFDCVIIYVFLSPIQMETIIGTPNASHSALPLFCILAYCHSWLIENRFLKSFLIMILNHFLIFTGFGIFIGIITPFLLLTDLLFSVKNKSEFIKHQVLTLLVSICSFGMFFYNYTFNPAVDCFGKDTTALMEFIKFVSLLLSKSITLPYIYFKDFGVLAIPIGYVLFFLLSLTVLISFIIYLRSRVSDNKSKIILILSTFSLLYVINITIGRICLTLQASQAGRYATLVITGIFGIYLFLFLIKNKIIQTILISLFLILLIPGYIYSFKEGHITGSYYKNRKEG